MKQEDKDLTPREAQILGDITFASRHIKDVVEKITAHLILQRAEASSEPMLTEGQSIEEAERTQDEAYSLMEDATPERWLHIATTQLQQGLMAARRAILQPTEF